jgi:hypothetical protein
MYPLPPTSSRPVPSPIHILKSRTLSYPHPHFLFPPLLPTSSSLIPSPTQILTPCTVSYPHPQALYPPLLSFPYATSVSIDMWCILHNLGLQKAMLHNISIGIILTVSSHPSPVSDSQETTDLSDDKCVYCFISSFLFYEGSVLSFLAFLFCLFPTLS